MTGQPSLEDQARAIGAQHGANAASWVFDGNTSRETYARVLRGIEDGDPAVYDIYSEPNLSGEWADDYSRRQLLDDLGLSRDDVWADEYEEAYNESSSQAFWTEIERTARHHLEV